MPMGSGMSITLPDSMAEAVRARIASGRYADASEVIGEGLQALADRERAVENWLKDSVMRDYAAWEAGTLETVDLNAFREELARDRVFKR